MSRGQITKEHFKVLILQQKNKIFRETCDEKYKLMAQKHLNELIDKLEEFRY
jgi:hypothetical protein